MLRPIFVAGVLASIGAVALALSTALGPVIQVAPKQAPPPQKNSTIVVGGITRPISNIQKGRSRPQPPPLAMNATDEAGRDGYGKTPKIDATGRPAHQSIAESLRKGPISDKPELFSPLIPAKPFSKVEFERNPKAFLESVEPGRVWQTAQPATGVPVLKRISPKKQKMIQKEAIRLAVQTAPKGVVCFTSFDLGAFTNDLTSIAIQADENGIAETTFTASSGTINRVNILAASPMASGRVQFQVDISLK